MFKEEPKKKRQPNKWQLFLKGCLKEQPNGGLGEKVTACGVQYRGLKEKNPKYLDELVNKAELQKKTIPIPIPYQNQNQGD